MSATEIKLHPAIDILSYDDFIIQNEGTKSLIEELKTYDDWEETRDGLCLKYYKNYESYLKIKQEQQVHVDKKNEYLRGCPPSAPL